MGSKGTNTVETQSGPPQQYLDAYSALLGQAQNVASQPLNQYSGQMVAGLSPDQQAAMGTIAQSQGIANPYINAAAQAASSSATPINPMSFQGVQDLPTTGMNYANQAANTDIAGAGAGSIGTAGQYANTAAQQATSIAGNAGQQATSIAGNAGQAANSIAGNAGQNANAIAGMTGLNATSIAGNAGQAANSLAGQAANNANNYASGAVNAANTDVYSQLPQFNQSTLASYESPYTQDVVNATQAQFNNANAQQQQGVISNAISSGAFGGDRASVAQALTAGQQQLAQAPVIANLENQGYTQAASQLTAEQQLQANTQSQQAALAAQTGLGAANSAVSAGQLGANTNLSSGTLGANTNLSAGQLGANTNLSSGTLGANTNLSAGQLGANTNLSSGTLGTNANISAGQLGSQTGLSSASLQQQAAQQQGALQQGAAGQVLGEFNTQQGVDVGAQEASNQLEANAGNSLAALGTEAQTTTLNGASAQLQSGALQQQQEQSQLNIPYEEFQQEQAYPYQNTSYMAGIAEGTGSGAGSTSSTTSPGANLGSQLVGLGATGLSAYGAASNAGLFNSAPSSSAALTNLTGTDTSGVASGFGSGVDYGFNNKGGVVRPGRDIGGGVPITSAVPNPDVSYGTQNAVGAASPIMGSIKGSTGSTSAAPTPDSTMSDIMTAVQIAGMVAALNKGGRVERANGGSTASPAPTSPNVAGVSDVPGTAKPYSANPVLTGLAAYNISENLAKALENAGLSSDEENQGGRIGRDTGGYIPQAQTMSMPQTSPYGNASPAATNGKSGKSGSPTPAAPGNPYATGSSPYSSQYQGAPQSVSPSGGKGGSKYGSAPQQAGNPYAASSQQSPSPQGAPSGGKGGAKYGSAPQQQANPYAAMAPSTQSGQQGMPQGFSGQSMSPSPTAGTMQAQTQTAQSQAAPARSSNITAPMLSTAPPQVTPLASNLTSNYAPPSVGTLPYTTTNIPTVTGGTGTPSTTSITPTQDANGWWSAPTPPPTVASQNAAAQQASIAQQYNNNTRVDDTASVDALYQGLLGRAPESSVPVGNETNQALYQQILASPEYASLQPHAAGGRTVRSTGGGVDLGSAFSGFDDGGSIADGTDDSVDDDGLPSDVGVAVDNAGSLPAAPPAAPPADLALSGMGPSSLNPNGGSQTGIGSYTPPEKGLYQKLADSPWMALATAGLGMMAGTSNNALTNIGAGALQGVKYLDNQQQQEQKEQQADQQGKYQNAELGLRGKEVDNAAAQLQNSMQTHRDTLDLNYKQLAQQGQISQAQLDEKTANDQQSRNIAQEQLDQGKYSIMPGSGVGDDGKPIQGSYVVNSKTGETEFRPGVVLSPKTGGPSIDPAALSNLATRYNIGDPSVLQSISARDIASRNALINEADKQAQEQGLTSAQIAENRATFSKGMGAEATGPIATATRANNVALTHLDTLGNLADALDNGNVQMLNSAQNAFKQQFGSAAPTNFEAAKNIVGDEIVKAVVNSGGAQSDREAAQSSVNKANSPGQLHGVINTYQKLLAGQLSGLRQQYTATTGQNDYNRFLSPAAIRNLNQYGPSETNSSPSKSASSVPSSSVGNDPLASARNAIAQGADRQQVIQRVRSMGLDPSGL